MTHAPHIAEAFATALGSRSYADAAGLLTPDVELRAILPARDVLIQGREEVTGQFADWLDWATSVELDALEATQVSDRTTMTWRVLLRTDRPSIGDRVMEQHLVLDISDEGIESIGLVCTGMRPISVPDVEVHDFDAGTLGCTDGFTTELRRRIRAIDVGHHLRVIARDPSAKEDLPSMTRLMGHRLLETLELDDGATCFTLERAR
jgi:TusA-related sulfurtransferase